MSVTRPNITLPIGVWTNLYTASGITAGTAITVVNKGIYACVVAVSAAAPSGTTTGFPLGTEDESSYITISRDEVGVWAYSPQGNTEILVQEGSTRPGVTVTDSISTEGQGSHAYTYNSSLQLTTDTWTVSGSSVVKTYTYNSNGTLATESDWV